MNPCTLLRFAISLVGFQSLVITKVAAHCDSLDGPVVAAAKLALQAGDVTSALKWVPKADEKEIRDVFTLTLKIRSLGEDARALADTHFFETLVRIHRAGEGEPFTGLKPAGTTAPAFRAADRAVEERSATQLTQELTRSVQEGLRKRFAAVIEKQKHAEESIEAGRAYVAAYVDYVHFVESIHTLSAAHSETPPPQSSHFHAGHK